MRLLFRSARLVDEARDRPGDLLVEDGRISRITLPGALPRRHADIVVEAAGLTLMPAFVDLHVHFRDPGFPDKETLESGCLAAAAGGFGTVVAMANTRPATSRPEQALATRARARVLGLVDYFPAITMTRDLDGKDHAHLDGFEAALSGPGGEGLRVLSDDGRDLADPALMLSVFRRAAELGVLVSCHCELPGSATDREAEVAGVERALALGRGTGARIHLAHVSTRASIELIRLEKAGGQARMGDGRDRITCEATPHHLALTSARAVALGASSLGRVNPHLRDEGDRLAVIEGLRDGTIDAIATDHAPHSMADKEAGAPGFSGLETAFALSWTSLAKEGFDLRGLPALMSAKPARLLGLGDRGRLEAGLRADLVLLDPEADITVDPAAFRSRGKNTPIAGMVLHGRILMTLHGGRIVYDDKHDEH